MLKLCTLFSGSSGNCVYISDGKTKLLVDCGVSGKKIAQGLNQIGVNPDEIDAILVTHEHIDHIQSVGIMHRRHKTRIYANEKTYNASSNIIGKHNEGMVVLVNGTFSIGDIEIKPFMIPHDAASPIGYSFNSGGQKITVATDIGHVQDSLYKSIKGSDMVLIESNHDVEMLTAGPYPYMLKRRILGNTGHLSNACAGELCARLVKSGTRKILLGHLSQQNNLPSLAFETVKGKMREENIIVGKDVELFVADRHQNSALFAV